MEVVLLYLCLQGYGDNLSDALNGVKELHNVCDDIEKACDLLGNQIAQTAPQVRVWCEREREREREEREYERM